MTPIQAQNALQSHLQAMPGRPPLAYENGPIVKALPRIVVAMPTVPQRTVALDATELAEAQIIARVEVEDGKLAGEAEAICEAIIAHFTSDSPINGVSVLKPTLQTRYPANGFYHMPILIRGQFHH